MTFRLPGGSLLYNVFRCLKVFKWLQMAGLEWNKCGNDHHDYGHPVVTEFSLVFRPNLIKVLNNK